MHDPKGAKPYKSRLCKYIQDMTVLIMKRAAFLIYATASVFAGSRTKSPLVRSHPGVEGRVLIFRSGSGGGEAAGAAGAGRGGGGAGRKGEGGG